jgi:hypothetical protein
MDLSAELTASGLSAAADAVAAINAGWEMSAFKETSVADLRRIYPMRLAHIRSISGAHAAQLARSTEELVGRLSNAGRVEIGFIRGKAEYHFVVFRDADRQAAIGVLRVVSKLDVPSERWEQLWERAN